MCQNIKETNFVRQYTWVQSFCLRDKWPPPQNMAVTKAAFKGSLQRGGWLSTCSARGADLHRLLQKCGSDLAVSQTKRKKGHR